MRLTLHTDYALRALILLASAGQQGSTALEIASRHGVSANHMQKILQRLRALGFVETVRGRGGGVRLAVQADGEGANAGDNGSAQFGVGEVVAARLGVAGRAADGGRAGCGRAKALQAA